MDPDERLSVFKNMAEADPENELAHFSLGRLYFERGELEEAESSLRRTLELNPGHSLAHRVLGETLLGLGRRDEALEVLRAGVVLAHEHGEYQPRNQMQALLRREGVEPPELPVEERDDVEESEDVVRCRRCLRYGGRLDEPPLKGELGRTIYETICEACWREWIAMSIKVINEYRLNLATPQGNHIYEVHMKEFLGLA